MNSFLIFNRKLKMLYINYNQLSESNQLDILFYHILIRWQLIMLFLMYGSNILIMSLAVLAIRTLTPDVYIRRSLGWVMVLLTFFNGVYVWTYIFLIIEGIREFTRFGIPYLINRLGNNISHDPIGETFMKRIFRIIKITSQQHLFITSQQIMLALMSYSQGDASEGLSEEEQRKFKNFFVDFRETSFIYEFETSALCVFFPSFIIRFSQQGIQITSDEAMKLIRGDDDNCPICMEKFADLSIELKCGHKFCHKCIFMWLSANYSCPLCRAEIH
jgi:hypothetical protein